MDSAESPKTAFELIYTRWEKAPELITYDNCCRLMDYCLNREPEHFKNTCFLVDAMHYKNHTNCSCAFNIKESGPYKRFNSQLCEQKNAKLVTIRDSAAYMKQTNFIFLMRHVLYLLNTDPKAYQLRDAEKRA